MDWQPGDWAVVRSRGPAGRLVYVMERLAGWSGDWEHAITGLPDGMIGEAEPGGYRIVPFRYDPADVVWSTGRLPAHLTPDSGQRDLIVAAHRRYAARKVPYSDLDYAALAAKRFHIPVPGLQDFVADTGRMICSQAVAAGQLEGGISLFPGRWTGYNSPDDLALLLGLS